MQRDGYLVRCRARARPADTELEAKSSRVVMGGPVFTARHSILPAPTARAHISLGHSPQDQEPKHPEG